MSKVSTHRSSGKKPAAGVPEGFACVLVPLDLKPASDRILGRAMRLPLAENARVTLLHVVPDVLSPRNRRSAARDAMKALAREIQHYGHLLRQNQRFEPVVTEGTAAKEISVCAARENADLVVMGRGGGRVTEAFLGSTAERVVRQAKRPVLVVRVPARMAYCRPAVAIDLHPSALNVVRALLEVIPPPRPEVTVIHAFDEPYHDLIYPSLYEAAKERKTELQRRATRDLEGLLAIALKNADVAIGEGPRWKNHVRYGSPRSVIIRGARNTEADLLVLGTRGHQGLAYAFLGTVAGDVLRHATCDVLVVPPQR